MSWTILSCLLCAVSGKLPMCFEMTCNVYLALCSKIMQQRLSGKLAFSTWDSGSRPNIQVFRKWREAIES